MSSHSRELLSCVGTAFGRRLVHLVLRCAKAGARRPAQARSGQARPGGTASVLPVSAL